LHKRISGCYLIFAHSHRKAGHADIEKNGLSGQGANESIAASTMCDEHNHIFLLHFFVVFCFE